MRVCVCEYDCVIVYIKDLSFQRFHAEFSRGDEGSLLDVFSLNDCVFCPVRRFVIVLNSVLILIKIS